MVWADTLSSVDVITHVPTAEQFILVFGVWLQSVPLGEAILYSVLYPQYLTFNANPKVISGRTSYLQVRLEFHPYPQVIQALFSVPWFGPPISVT